MQMRRKPAVMSLVVTTLFAAGCGGGDGGGATTLPAPVASTSTLPATTSTVLAATTVPATTVTTVAGPDLTAKANAAIIQKSDLPAGWEPVAPEDPSLNIEPIWKALITCLGVPAVTPAGIATSPTYKRGLATQARSTVEYTTEASATGIATALAGPKFTGCANDAFNADAKISVPEGGVAGPVTIGPRTGAPKSFTYRINHDVNLGELKVPIFQDYVVIFSGGTIIRGMFLQPGDQFPPDLEKTLLEKVTSRA